MKKQNNDRKKRTRFVTDTWESMIRTYEKGKQEGNWTSVRAFVDSDVAKENFTGLTVSSFSRNYGS